MSDPDGLDPVFTTAVLRARTTSAARPRRRLVILDDAGTRDVTLPENGTLVIGRSRSVDVRIEDVAASRRHASLVLTPERVVLTDHESQNGTRVSGEIVRAARTLVSGDAIEIGDAVLLLVEVQPVAPPRITDLAGLRAQLDRELASERDETITVIAIRSDASSSAIQIELERWLGEARGLLVGPVHDGKVATVVARGIDEDVARGLAASIRASVEGATVGLAMAPQDGTDAVTLMCAAVDGCDRGHDERAASRRIGDLDVIVADPAAVRLHALAERLARSDLPIVIGGETGTGKEVIARVIHHASPRRHGAYLAINCAALSDALAESELFGHEKGAFTGAVSARAGLFESAAGGTLLFDEVAELSATVQAKLLRVLEQRVVVRLGSIREIPIDVRVLAATHVDLAERVARGTFREDLLHRLRGAVLTVPPLRERPRELAMLARLFLERACERLQERAPRFSPEAWRALRAHPFPGNVRELRNLMELLAATCADPIVEPHHLDEALASSGAGTLKSPKRERARALPARSLEEEIRDLERARIAEALEAEGGNQRRAAQRLGMPLRTFATRLATLGLRQIDRSAR